MNFNTIVKVLLFLIINFNFIVAQTIEPSKSVDKNMLEVETELFHSKEQKNNITTKSWNMLNFLIRYGVGNDTEINLAMSNSREKEFLSNHLGSSHHQFNFLKVGILQNLWEEKGFKPELAMMFNVLIPTTDSHEDANKVGFITGLNLSKALSEKWIFNYNIGYIKDVDTTDKYFYIGNLQFSINKNLILFTENTGEYHGDFDWTQSLGFGYSYQNWTLEVVTGKGFSSPNFFVGGKLIKLFNLKKKATTGVALIQ